MVTYVKVNREKSHPCEGLRQGYFRSLCSVRFWDSTGQNVKHKERETANHCVRDGYFKTSECHPDLGNSYYVVNAQNSSGGMSKEASVEKKKKNQSEMLWNFTQPCILPVFFLGCIFLCLSFLWKTLAISGTPELTAIPVKAYCRWFIAWGVVHSLLCRHWHWHSSVKQLPQINAQKEVGDVYKIIWPKVLKHLGITFFGDNFRLPAIPYTHSELIALCLNPYFSDRTPP